MTTRVLITGGCGFIGSNLAAHCLKQGAPVTVYDNLSRAGSSKNADWLKATGYSRLRIVNGDIRDFSALRQAMAEADVVFHLAAQVAVTTSIERPREDFEINAWGGLNVLEAARQSGRNPILIYTSTNKIYGAMANLRLINGRARLRAADYPHGIPEEFPLDLHSPYGCSKGTCDQYVRDYARIYGLRTVVFRQSCIYGPRQFGMEDQGWVAHFAISALLGHPITIYGDGRQVRDLLHIRDLIAAFESAVENIETCQGQAYNIGGGPQNSASLLEVAALLEEVLGKPIALRFGDWRPGDQKFYVSDVRQAQRDLGWEPRLSPREGIAELCSWISRNRELFQ